MVSIKQWVLTALASVALVSFVTHECLRVDLPRDASHAAWKDFVETHLAFYSAADQRRAWLVLMGVQSVQLALGIPFLHVTQVCMGFVLPVAAGIASCTCLEVLAFAGYVWLGDRAIATPDLHTLSYIMTIARTHRQRLAYTFALLMSSMPIYISVLSVHVKLVSRREFWYLSGAASLFSVSKNIVSANSIDRQRRHLQGMQKLERASQHAQVPPLVAAAENVKGPWPRAFRELGQKKDKPDAVPCDGAQVHGRGGALQRGVGGPQQEQVVHQRHRAERGDKHKAAALARNAAAAHAHARREEPGPNPV
jgi:hypothetical protein